jgi:hypothetical protein
VIADHLNEIQHVECTPELDPNRVRVAHPASALTIVQGRAIHGSGRQRGPQEIHKFAAIPAS